MAQVLVQNRVSLALPVIPDLVQRAGHQRQEEVAQHDDDRQPRLQIDPATGKSMHDDIFLSNYATIQIKDELGRLPGVANVTYLGERDYSMRAWLDPDKLATLGLSADDVVTAISEQNLQVAAGQIGQEPVAAGTGVPADHQHAGPADRRRAVRRHHPQGRPRRARTARPPSIVRLRDVARVELGSPAIRPVLHARRQAVGGPVDLPAARLERPQDGPGRLRQDGGAEETLPAGPRLQDRLRHDALHPRIDHRGLQDAPRRDHPGGHRGAGLPAELAGDA